MSKEQAAPEGARVPADVLEALDELTPRLAMVSATGSTNDKPRLGLGGAKEVIALVEAALNALPSEPAAAEAVRTAWMIEVTGFQQPMWWTGQEVGEFTSDPNAAVRFPTNEAAGLILKTFRAERPRKFFRLDLSCYAITEHKWEA